MMEAANPSQNSANIYQNTQRHQTGLSGGKLKIFIREALGRVTSSLA
jgi:hypothetical protein